MISRKVDVKKLKGDKEVLQHHLDKKGNVIRRVNEEDAVIVLKKMDTQIIIRSGSRLRWWISKFLWLVTYAVVYTGICMLVVALYTLANGASLNLHLTMSVAMVFTKKSFLLCSLLRLLCIAVVQPVLLLVLLGTIQMALSMKISEIIDKLFPIKSSP